MSYHTTSAVLLLVYNRPEKTKKVFDAIAEARPPRLYIAADAPKADTVEQANLCAEVKTVVSHVTWPCEVKQCYRETHLGCKEAVSTAIDWFFKNEEEGIILEDDCIPAEDFFRFCDLLLERYRNDKRVTIIGGSNLQSGKMRGEASYYFSNLTHVWGWASWRRVWQRYDKNLTAISEPDVANSVARIFNEPIITRAWTKIFNGVKNGVIDTWDYQFTFINFINNGLSIIPNTNLVTNIGFGDGATHTVNTASKYAGTPAGNLGEISHPKVGLPQTQADLATLYHDFDVERIKRKEKKWHRRLKRWFKNLGK